MSEREQQIAAILDHLEASGDFAVRKHARSLRRLVGNLLEEADRGTPAPCPEYPSCCYGRGCNNCEPRGG